MLLNSKVSSDCVSGGGGERIRITRPTIREKVYTSDLVIYLRQTTQKPKELILDIGKDRNGNKGVKDLPEAIDTIASMLCRYKFQDRNHMFQTSLTLRLIEAMREVLLGDDVIPTQKEIKKYIEGGKNE